MAFAVVKDIGALLEIQHATWAQAAASFGTTMHPLAQYARLVRRDYGEAEGVIAADGWRYSPPDEGCLDRTSLTVVATVLSRHSTTPETGIAAIWDGWDGLSSAGRVFDFEPEPDGERQASSIDEAPGRSAGSALRGRLAETVGQVINAVQGTVRQLRGRARSDSGPRFALHAATGRDYVMFEAGAQDFADTRWPARAPWVGDVTRAQSPSILWPEDRAWVLATDIDFDSTLIAGTAALVEELIQTPGLEVLAVRPDADLTSDGDLLNRPG
ncbi:MULTISPECIES: hypothetical protein [Citricoccus]|uniref:hypothetical protein n=1 Tax=Citricoccus TaxID=169133 RepID=UPI000255EF37|nr:hypothetical protein [Citricoccus sp. CH26A]